VGRGRDVETGPLAQGLDETLDEAHGHPLVLARDEERRVRGHREAVAAVESQEICDRLARDHVERDRSLAVMLRQAGREVERRAGLAIVRHHVDVEADQLADAQAGVQVEGQHGVVADAEGIAQVDGCEQAGGFFGLEVLHGGVPPFGCAGTAPWRAAGLYIHCIRGGWGSQIRWLPKRDNHADTDGKSR